MTGGYVQCRLCVQSYYETPEIKAPRLGNPHQVQKGVPYVWPLHGSFFETHHSPPVTEHRLWNKGGGGQVFVREASL